MKAKENAVLGLDVIFLIQAKRCLTSTSKGTLLLNISHLLVTGLVVIVAFIADLVSDITKLYMLA